MKNNVNPIIPQFYYIKVRFKGVTFTRACYPDDLYKIRVYIHVINIHQRYNKPFVQLQVRFAFFNLLSVLQCPECRKDIKLGKNGVAGLPKNFQLGGIVASYKENMDSTHVTQQSNSRLPSCTTHRAPCPLQCKKCRTPVCLQCVCSDQHATHPFSITDDNQDLFDRQSDIYCDIHTREYRLFCKTCQGLVCLKCLTTKDHTKHLYSAIDSAYEHRKVRFTPFL